MSDVNPDFWLNRWNTGRIGWHQTEVEPALVSWASKLPASRIFIPLCGKTLDLKWCADHGHHAIGAELSAEGCNQFFEEQGLIPTKTLVSGFTKYETPGITIFQGNFFDLTRELLGEVHAIYDRGALIAISPSDRMQYSQKLMSLTLPELKLTLSSDRTPFSFLQIILTRTPHDETGPPFSVSIAELNRLYGKQLQIELISEETVDASAPEGSTTVESVYCLKVKF
jgi:thiopurine S-methyltransferase